MSLRKAGRSKPKRKVKSRKLPFLLTVGLMIFFVAYLSIRSHVAGPEKPSLKAAVLDQLSPHYPNPAFIEAANSTIRQAGLKVDVYESVTVDLYRTLPSYGYRLIVFRVHAGVYPKGNYVALFTAEPYSLFKYQQEQLADLLGEGWTNQSDTGVFAVPPNFIRESSVANYQGAVIVLMGCTGLYSRDLPQAFIDRGASVVIGWNYLVGVAHTDSATLTFLRMMLLERMSIAASVAATMSQTGADPDYGSVLEYYPNEEGSLTFSQLFSAGARQFELLTCVSVLPVESDDPHGALHPHDSG
jgi:hypothetical protein